MDKVSIIIPVYNAGEKLKRCLDSVCGQSYTNLQIIIVDDGSEDNSHTICGEYAEKDSRITVISQENRGVSAARNTGLNHVNGNYLMFLDADDYVLLDMVERYLELAKESNADIVIGGLRMQEHSGAFYNYLPRCSGTMTLKDFLSEVCCCENGLYGYVPNKMYRHHLVQKNALRFPEYMAAQEDLSFALSAYAVANSFCTFSYCGYVYHYTPGKRDIPVEHLLKNQKTLLDLIIRADLDRGAYAPVVRNIQNITYAGLFHSCNLDGILNLAAFPELQEDICRIPIEFGEKKLILKWFCLGKYNRIIRYFKFRSQIKQFLRKNQL